MKKLRAADLFCGAGGTTTGAEASGFVDVVLAVNHWRTAVQTHRENHPATRHICARMGQSTRPASSYLKPASRNRPIGCAAMC